MKVKLDGTHKAHVKLHWKLIILHIVTNCIIYLLDKKHRRRAQPSVTEKSKANCINGHSTIDECFSISSENKNKSKTHWTMDLIFRMDLSGLRTCPTNVHTHTNTGRAYGQNERKTTEIVTNFPIDNQLFRVIQYAWLAKRIATNGFVLITANYKVSIHLNQNTKYLHWPVAIVLSWFQDDIPLYRLQQVQRTRTTAIKSNVFKNVGL